MAACPFCKREMLTADSCIPDEVSPTARLYGEERSELPLSTGPRCRDCNVTKGGTHHVECLMAECERCEQQFSLCQGRDCDAVHAWATGGRA